MFEKKKKNNLAPVCMVMAVPLILTELLFYLFILPKAIAKGMVLHIFRETIQVRTCMSNNRVNSAKLLRQRLTC